MKRFDPARLALIWAIALLCPVAGNAGETDFRMNGSQGSLGFTLQWSGAETGTAFTVHYKDSLQDSIWRIPPAFGYPLSSNVWTDPEPTNSQRFYRAVKLPETRRGALLSSTFVAAFTKQQISFLFVLAGIPLTPDYGVVAYKVVYETVGPWGAPTVASGALVLPDVTTAPLPLVSYQHGTITDPNGAPSSMDVTGEAGIGFAFASAGYAAVVPDYLGLGESPGPHYYHHARSQATACIDMLRATRTFCESNSIALNEKLFLVGYSQGGHATMATLRELEKFHTNEFTVTACAPMAGAYDLSGTAAMDFMSEREQPNPYYFLYLLHGFQAVYGLGNNLAELLSPPYDQTLSLMMATNASGAEINRAMPARTVDILKPEQLQLFQTDARHPLRLALQDNDVFRWAPRTPVRLYHCSGDQDVVIANSLVAAAVMQALGAADVQLIQPAPGADHGGCAEPALVAAKAWFDSLR